METKMAETPKKKPYVGTRLVKESNEAGSPIIDERTGEWKNGHVLIELFDGKTGQMINHVKKPVTRLGFLAWREEFNSLSTEDVIAEYFPNGDTNPVELKEDKPENDELKAALAKIAELEAEKAAREDVEKAFEAQKIPAGATVELPVEEVELKVEEPKATPKKKAVDTKKK